jgi:hypothetical protein
MGTAAGNKSIGNHTMARLANADGRQCSGRQRGDRRHNNQLAVGTTMTTTTMVLAVAAVTTTTTADDAASGGWDGHHRVKKGR